MNRLNLFTTGVTKLVVATLGFTLVFGVIAAGIGAVVATGYISYKWIVKGYDENACKENVVTKSE